MVSGNMTLALIGLGLIILSGIIPTLALPGIALFLLGIGVTVFKKIIGIIMLIELGLIGLLAAISTQFPQLIVIEWGLVAIFIITFLISYLQNKAINIIGRVVILGLIGIMIIAGGKEAYRIGKGLMYKTEILINCTEQNETSDYECLAQKSVEINDTILCDTLKYINESDYSSVVKCYAKITQIKNDTAYCEKLNGTGTKECLEIYNTI